MAKYYAVMDKSKKHIKMDTSTGRIYIFENKIDAVKGLEELTASGWLDLYASVVKVTVTKFKETEHD